MPSYISNSARRRARARLLWSPKTKLRRRRLRALSSSCAVMPSRGDRLQLPVDHLAGLGGLVAAREDAPHREHVGAAAVFGVDGDLAGDLAGLHQLLVEPRALAAGEHRREDVEGVVVGRAPGGDVIREVEGGQRREAVFDRPGALGGLRGEARVGPRGLAWRAGMAPKCCRTSASACAGSKSPASEITALSGA